MQSTHSSTRTAETAAPKGSLQRASTEVMNCQNSGSLNL